MEYRITPPRRRQAAGDLRVYEVGTGRVVRSIPVEVNAHLAGGGSPLSPGPESWCTSPGPAV